MKNISVTIECWQEELSLPRHTYKINVLPLSAIKQEGNEEIFNTNSVQVCSCYTYMCVI